MKENKVGILTFYYANTNYGGQCQAYALQKALTEIGFKAEQLCYKTTSVEIRYDIDLKEKLKKLVQKKV